MEREFLDAKAPLDVYVHVGKKKQDRAEAKRNHQGPVKEKTGHRPEGKQGEGNEKEGSDLDLEVGLLQPLVDKNGEVQVRKNLMQNGNIAKGLDLQDLRKKIDFIGPLFQMREALFDIRPQRISVEEKIPAEHDQEDKDEYEHRDQDHEASPVKAFGRRRYRSRGGSRKYGSSPGISAGRPWDGTARPPYRRPRLPASRKRRCPAWLRSPLPSR